MPARGKEAGKTARCRGHVQDGPRRRRGSGSGDDIVYGDELPTPTATVTVDLVARAGAFGWYNRFGGFGEILDARTLADGDPETVDARHSFTLLQGSLEPSVDALRFFIIPDGYTLNSRPGRPLEGDPQAPIAVRVTDANTIELADGSYTFRGRLAPAFFSEDERNPGGENPYAGVSGGNDILSGGDRDDGSLQGGSGTDRLAGGSGDDELRGEDFGVAQEADVFDFTADGNGAPDLGTDTILDFAPRVDVLDFTARDAIFAYLDGNGDGRVDDADADASLEDGVLTLTVPDEANGGATAGRIEAVIRLEGVEGLEATSFV